MAIINIEIDEKDLRSLILTHLERKLGDVELKDTDIKILVKSKQNYKAEWEEATFKASIISYKL